jgi:energy-coupling factor transporter ATP-binding protein EcfA2
VIVALELRGVTKRYTAGSGACVASANVLCGVNLAVGSGESVALAGPAGAGKSTLMLCAAGLLGHEAGDVRWFGEADRAVAARRVSYHCTPWNATSLECGDRPLIHLLDFASADVDRHTMARWIDTRCAAGDAIVVATRDEELAHHLASRVLVLRGGRAYPQARPRSRVAEYAGKDRRSSMRGFVDHSFGDA